jgi:hypothetical protein
MKRLTAILLWAEQPLPRKSLETNQTREEATALLRVLIRRDTRTPARAELAIRRVVTATDPFRRRGVDCRSVAGIERGRDASSGTQSTPPRAMVV